MSVKLSLICPVYKVAKYIPDLMNSLLQGVNTEDVEIIFVDDCCPEKSIDLCEKFIKDNEKFIKFKSIILRQVKNQGLSAARNVALKEAQGVYVGFIDSDDAIAPHYWNTLKPYIEEESQDIIEFAFEEFTRSLPFIDQNEEPALSSSNLSLFYNGFFVWTRLYKSDVIAGLVFPVGKIYEDMFFSLCAFTHAKNSIRISKKLIYYRKRIGSITTTRTSRYSELLINLVTATEQNIENMKNQEQIISLLQKRSLILMLKGLKISDKNDRATYYSLCSPSLISIKKLSRKYGSDFKSKIIYFAACQICKLLKN